VVPKMTFLRTRDKKRAAEYKITMLRQSKQNFESVRITSLEIRGIRSNSSAVYPEQETSKNKRRWMKCRGRITMGGSHIPTKYLFVSNEM
jgi:hypothetical protein